MKPESTADAWRAAAKAILAIADALAVDTSVPSAGGCTFLFVELRSGETFGDTLRAEIQRRCATVAGGPVPDAIYAAPSLPRDDGGRVLDTAVRRMMTGEPAAGVAAEERVANPASLEYFAWLFNNL